MRIVTAHQVEHLGWLGLFDKFSKADCIILCDTMQFEKDNWHNRNKIRSQSGSQWLNVPVEHDNHKPIKDVRIVDVRFWRKKYLKSIMQNYCKAPYFDVYYPTIEQLINEDNDYLIDLNIKLLYCMFKWFKIGNKEYCFLSQLNIDENLKSTDRLIEMSRKTNADVFLAGMCGNTYIEQEKFKEANIILDFHKFEHPIYKQQFESFLPNMAGIDYLFNCGER